MQKINIILPALFLASFYLQAAQEVPAVSIPQQATGMATPDAPPVTAGQEQIVRALQDDIAFEQQKRQLSNELALEKTGFTHSDLLCWQIDYAGGSLNVNGTIMRDTYRI